MKYDLETLKSMMPPFAKLMGVNLTVAEPELIEASLLITPELCTIGDRAHGGALMSLADTIGAIGAIVNLRPEDSGTVTLESKTNLLSGAKVGDTVFVRSVPLHRGRRSQVWQSQIEDENGRAIAVTIQTQMTL